MNRDVLLISLQEDLDVIGLRSLHYQLLKHGFASHILFIPKFPSAAISDAVYNLIDKLSPLFIGISLMSIEYDRAMRLTHVLKSHYPSIPILWGGIHPTVAPETCLDYADFICIGEGESFIVDFANAVASGSSPEALGSLVFRRTGQVIQNPLYLLMADLSAIPACEHVPRDSYVLHKGTITPLNIRTFRKYARYSGTTYSIMSSRGCPFSCTYCCNNALAKIYNSKKVRFRELSSVIDELRMAITQYPFIEYINFQDDCFLSRSDEELERFCHLYKQEIKRPFIARSIPTFITERKIVSMKSAGLAWISLGLQSGSDRVCREVYERRSGKQDFLKAAWVIKNQDLAAFYDVILDNPFETDEDRVDTVLTLMETPKPFYTQYFSLSLYPGTELRRRAIEEGLIKGDEYLSKDYQLYNKTSINNLVRLATFIPSSWLRLLLELFRLKSTSLWFKMNLSVARLFAIAFAEPITYLKIIRLSQSKKLGATIRVLPYYMKEGLSRFRKQFG
ncbi:MAG: B12-binding domain-containing radical SAM protein [Candidatus Omnitrophica bacterium]|nr:B12-binding domain-containing radical SAM protein [Candidatus Omnitrophota bacterium]